MERLKKARRTRVPALPYTLLLLTVVASCGVATIGRAGEVIEELVVVAPRFPVADAQLVRAQIEDAADDATWRTQIRIASELRARLTSQGQPYRLAKRSRSWTEPS